MLTPSFVSSIEPPVATHEVITTDELAKRIRTCSQEKFTGRLDLVIKDPKGQQWSLYFYQGGLIWGTSEVHPLRRWHRQLSIHCPQLAVDSNNKAVTRHPASVPTSPQPSTDAQQSIKLKCLDYNSLAELVRQGKVLRKQMATVVEGNITEILFDIHQRWERLRYRSGLQLSYRRISKDIIQSTVVLIPVDQVLPRVTEAWDAWQEAGLVDCFPNQAPVIWRPEELRRDTSPIVYQNLTALVDGNQTLRDLAVKLRQNLQPLTQSIMPYIRNGLMGLLEVEDFGVAVKPVTTTKPQPASVATPVTPVPPQPTSPLIACIDDSRMDSLAMSQILTQAGYRCISVQDPVKALPTLLEHKPDLIFLDLVMPVTNGYEVCAQIRRISILKNTPVIILTSNDGIVDRVRAKMVGSSGFLAKPIEREKVLAIIQKYLAAPRPILSQKLQTLRTWSLDQKG